MLADRLRSLIGSDVSSKMASFFNEVGKAFGWLGGCIVMAANFARRSFWINRVFARRVLPITIAISFLLWNPFLPDFTDWTKHRWERGHFFWPGAEETGIGHLFYLLCAVSLFTLLFYLINSAWKGYGEHKFKAFLPMAIIGILGAMLVVAGIVPQRSHLFWFMISVGIGIWTGVGFSCPMIQMYWRGVRATSGEEHTVAVHGHDPYTDHHSDGGDVHH